MLPDIKTWSAQPNRAYIDKYILGGKTLFTIIDDKVEEILRVRFYESTRKSPIIYCTFWLWHEGRTLSRSGQTKYNHQSNAFADALEKASISFEGLIDQGDRGIDNTLLEIGKALSYERLYVISF